MQCPHTILTISGSPRYYEDFLNGKYEYDNKTNCKASYTKNENGISKFIKWLEEADYQGYVIGYNYLGIDYYAIYTDGKIGYSSCPSDRSIRRRWRYFGKPVRSIINNNSKSRRVSRLKLIYA